MYFKKLELVGFKSFMDKTVLNFEPGITAIVGPNGCGKSNIFDAIRWVLGEQSAKSLRGSDMEDVIFNGTDLKQPLGLAEVSLTFDNSQKQFSVEHDEVMITRRIFRSGESEYLLNRTTVRLKDIQDLLFGTGIGAESYSIIAQGKIDLILSSKPEDRRLVFDEASGITKYKTQKREALRKLEETEQNLLRLGDIITEVKRSIGYLERQANKARRYQAAFAELKSKEVNLALLEKTSLNQEISAVNQKIDLLKEDEQRLESEIAEEENKIDQRKMELENLENNLAEIKSSIASCENIIQRNDQQANFNQERIKELKENEVELAAEIAQAKNRIVEDEEKLNKLKEEQDNFEKNLAEKTSALQENEAHLENLVAAIKNSLENIAQAKRNILELVQKISLAKNELTDLTAREQVFLARKKRLELEKAKVVEEKTQVEDSLNAVLADLEHLEKNSLELKVEMNAVKKEADSASTALIQIDGELEDLERKRLTLISQREFLARLKNQYEDISESMNAVVYLDKLPQEKFSGLVVKVKGHQNAEASAQEALKFKLSGEAKPIDLDAQKVSEKIQAVEGKITLLKDSQQQKQVQLQQLNAQLQELMQQEQEKQLAIANKSTVRQGISEQFLKIKEEEEIILLELSDVTGEMEKLSQKLETCKSGLAALENEHSLQDTTIHTEQQKIDQDAKMKEELLVLSAQIKTEIENLHKRLNSEDEVLKTLEEACRLTRENIANQEAKLKETQERQQLLEKDIQDLSQKNLILRNEIEAHSRFLGDEEKRYSELESTLNGVMQKIDERRQKQDNLRQKAYELQMAQKDLDYKYQSLKERLFSAYKVELDTISEDAFLKPEQVAIAPQDTSSSEAAAESPVAAAVFETDSQKLQAEISLLKEKIESYGTVNLVAIEEYDELKKRYDFLTQQQSDLLTAKESLQEAIRKINHTTKKMFMETFEKVRLEFKNYFKLLFGGGDAQVFLLDEQDPLESGIEIICRPPGKKLQNVMLLSGGEKALSAIALIFAIFKVKPAPFCVLDEIDAALDESNVDRFGRLLQDFAATSQFIVITHNKRTIANAGVMYGITMQESGVSKIVSVKFAANKTKEKEPEPVAA